MSNDLMIPDTADIPAHVKKAQAAAKTANDDAACGISTGFPPRIKSSGKVFKLVDGNGEEKSFPIKQLVELNDNAYMPVVIIRAKRALQKTWFASKYNPNEDAKAPDCFSTDGMKPHSSVQAPQCDTCANCPNNVFGSGTDQDGNATKGKACSDTKILAVLIPKHGVHSLKIPPASLKNFGLYVKQLTSRGIPLNTVHTLVGFNQDSDYSILEFMYGGFLKSEQAIKVVEDLADSEEVNDIIEGMTVEVPAAPVQAKPKKEETKKPKKEEKKDVLDLDLDLGISENAEEEKEEVIEAEVVKPKDSKSSDSDLAEMSDEDIMAELGL